MIFLIKNNVRFRADNFHSESAQNLIRTAQNWSDSEWKLGVCLESERYRVALSSSDQKTWGTEKYCTNGRIFNFLVCLIVTFPHFTQIFFISDISKLESFQRCLYLVRSQVLCFFLKWTFIKYFQITGSVSGQMGQWIGTLEQGEEAVNSVAML